MKVRRKLLIAAVLAASPILCWIGFNMWNAYHMNGTPDFDVTVDRVADDGSVDRSEVTASCERLVEVPQYAPRGKRLRDVVPGVDVDVRQWGVYKLGQCRTYDVERVSGPAIGVGHMGKDETFALLLPNKGRTTVAGLGTAEGVSGASGAWSPYGDDRGAVWFDGPSGTLRFSDRSDRSLPWQSSFLASLKVEAESGWVIDFRNPALVSEGGQVLVSRADGSDHGFEVGVDAHESYETRTHPERGDVLELTSIRRVRVSDAGRHVLTVTLRWSGEGPPVRGLRLVKL